MRFSGLVPLLLFAAVIAEKSTDEAAAWNWFVEYSEQAGHVYNAGSKLSWAYVTNITDENEQKMVSQECVE